MTGNIIPLSVCTISLFVDANSWRAWADVRTRGIGARARCVYISHTKIRCTTIAIYCVDIFAWEFVQGTSSSFIRMQLQQIINCNYFFVFNIYIIILC